MIDVKTAVKSATAYLKEIYSDFQVKDIRLEEVEMDQPGTYWLVTLSFSDKQPFSDRTYKLFRISADGEVQSMKIRTVL